MRESFQSFTSSYKIAPGSISYSDFVIVRLLYEATRDAGLWNLHWTITDMPPNSDDFRSHEKPFAKRQHQEVLSGIGHA